MTVGTVKFIKPQHPQLDRLIKGYYLHTAVSETFHSKVTFYQNVTTTISIYQDSQTAGTGHQRIQRHQPNKGIHALLVGQVDGYQEVEFIGPLQRIAIVFLPGGLNHFLPQPLSHYLVKHHGPFDYYQEVFNTLIPQVLMVKDMREVRRKLDHFFVSHLLGFDQPQLLKAIDMLLQNNDLKVQELAQQLKVNRRTLLRKFRTHLGYSIEGYKTTIKFRRALESFQNTTGQLNLSRIAQDGNYYDQADFNRQLKLTSGLTPKVLFDQLSIVDDTLFWKH